MDLIGGSTYIWKAPGTQTSFKSSLKSSSTASNSLIISLHAYPTILLVQQLPYIKMFSKTIIATLLASTVAASPIAASTSDATYILRTFPTGAGSIFRGLEITADNGYLWVGKQTTPAIHFSFNNGYVNTQEGQELYISGNTVTYAASGTDAENASGWEFVAPYSGPNISVGSLTYPGYDIYACSGSEADVYTIAAVPTGTGATGKCEQIQLIAQ